MLENKNKSRRVRLNNDIKLCVYLLQNINSFFVQVKKKKKK